MEMCCRYMDVQFQWSSFPSSFSLKFPLPLILSFLPEFFLNFLTQILSKSNHLRYIQCCYRWSFLKFSFSSSISYTSIANLNIKGEKITKMNQFEETIETLLESVSLVAQFTSTDPATAPATTPTIDFLSRTAIFLCNIRNNEVTFKWLMQLTLAHLFSKL